MEVSCSCHFVDPTLNVLGDCETTARREMGAVHRRWVRVKQHWGAPGGEDESGPAL